MKKLICILLFWILIVFCIVPGVVSGQSSYSTRVMGEIKDLKLSEDDKEVIVNADLIHSFNKEGTLLWKQWHMDRIDISTNGEYIVGASGKTVYLFNQHGKKLWEHDVATLISAIAISWDGRRIAAGSITGETYLFDQSGDLEGYSGFQWEEADEGINTNIVKQIPLSSDINSVHACALTENGLLVLDSDGDKLWETGLNELTNGKFVAITRNGKYIAIATTYKLSFFHGGGELLWDYRPNSEISSMALISNGDLIVIGTYDNKITLLNGQGKQLWNYKTSSRIMDIAIANDGGFIIAGSFEGKAYLLNRDGQLVSWWNLGEQITHVAISPDGSFPIVSSKSNIFGLTNKAIVETTVTPIVNETITTSVSTSPSFNITMNITPSITNPVVEDPLKQYSTLIQLIMILLFFGLILLVLMKKV